MGQRSATPREGEYEPCPVCGSGNRSSPDTCWDCFWSDDPEAWELPDEDVRPNYVSLNEARFILKTAGVAALKQANQAGEEAEQVRARFQAMIKDGNANHP
jgi:hypothetical protein